MPSRSKRSYAVRVVTGELAGTVVPLLERIDIGRASSCEIQLLETGISRTHAAVVVERSGEVVLVDLLSTNGTFVADNKVSRHVLELRDTFRVGSSEFVFELSGAGEPAPGPGAISGGRTWDETLVMPRASSSGPGSPATARGPESRHYPGNLLGDIVIFRNLRLSMARDGSLPAPMQGRYDRVADRLQAPAPEAEERRTFLRFSCDFVGKLTMADRATGRRMPGAEVVVLEVAVDGGRVTAPPGGHEVNDLCWLALPLVTVDGLRSVVFTARVVWVRDEELGLVFSGAPSFATRNRTLADSETQRQRIKPRHGDDD